MGRDVAVGKHVVWEVGISGRMGRALGLDAEAYLVWRASGLWRTW